MLGAGITVFINLSTPTKVLAASGTAIASGDWNAPSTWSFSGVNRVPTCGDIVNIPLTKTVTVNSQENLAGCGSPIIINVDGVLQFTNGNKLDLPCGSYVFIKLTGIVKKSTAGGGTSTLISICNVDLWKAGDGPLPGIDTLYVPGGASSLPIKLIYFKAKLENNTVNFDWATAAEINNNFFTVEKSSDGTNFEALFTKPGAGNSTTNIYYSANDDNPLGGYSYYRLKQTDYDGHYSYSDIQTIKNGSGSGDEPGKMEINSVAPNPFTDNFKVTFKVMSREPADFSLMSCSGEVIAQEKIQTAEGINTYEFIDKYNLRKGIYFITFLYNGEQITRKIIKN